MVLIGTLVAVLTTIGVAFVLLPWPNARAAGTVLREVLRAPAVTLRERLSMLGYLVRQATLLPLYLVFWIADEILARGYRKTPIEAPVFVIGQPRSGTTFLLRTLGEDRDRFISAQHLEWRYPSIVFWRLLERLGRREWLERRSYWPATPLGRLAERIHAHTLGVHEELGIFLEEKFLLHYFVFRRFPFPDVLEASSNYARLDERERGKVLDTLERVMRKIAFHRGKPGAIWLTKENEAVALHEDLLARFPDARIIVLARPADDCLASYRTMSETCTTVKHGVDPTRIDGWERANMDFRLTECRQFVDFARRLLADPGRRVIALTYAQLVGDVEGTVRRIYRELGIELSAEYAATLERLGAAQRRRRAGYRNAAFHDPRFDFFDRFVAELERSVESPTAVPVPVQPTVNVPETEAA